MREEDQMKDQDQQHEKGFSLNTFRMDVLREVSKHRGQKSGTACKSKKVFPVTCCQWDSKQ
jgi:hypothetical protein